MKQGQENVWSAPVADMQRAYLATAAALGASWCDFMSQRFHAYAHVIGDVSHCRDINEAWRVQATFGQETVDAYSDQAAKVGGLMMRAAATPTGKETH